LSVIPRIVYWEIGGDRRGDLMGGILFWGLAFSILSTTGGLMPFGAALVMGGLWVFEGFLFRRLRSFFKPEFAAPLSLFTTQWLVGEFFFGGVPWATWGLGFADNSWFLTMATAVGENGVSLLILLLGGWLWSFSRGWKGVGFLCPVLLLFAFEIGRTQESEPVSHVSFAAVQPNLGLGAKTANGGEVAIFQKHESMLSAALGNSAPPELLCWAETMFLLPATLSEADGEIRIPRRGLPGQPTVYPADGVRDLMEHAAAQVASPLSEGGHFLTGAHTYEPVAPELAGNVVSPRSSSTLVFNQAGALVGNVGKSELVPFGETLPFDGRFPGSPAIANWVFEKFGLSPDFARAPEPEPLLLSRPDGTSWSLGTAVCWENAFERVFREQAQGNCQAFIIFSNEAWYGLGAEMDQMVATTRFRAAETGRAILRATNTGITVLMDSRGKEITSLPRGTESVLFGELPLVDEGVRTPYLVWGWVVSPLLSSLCLLLVGLATLKGKTGKEKASGPPLS
jgi:apolipoprotein N-acyltransferase